jgi:predicted 3-demethylubiquinone-9 3-methyltransferase (glyoxalase superfamily)
MRTFAVIHNGTVSNVIVCDTQETAETLTNAMCVEYTEENPAAIGWIYDGKNFGSEAPAPTK